MYRSAEVPVAQLEMAILIKLWILCRLRVCGRMDSLRLHELNILATPCSCPGRRRFCHLVATLRRPGGWKWHPHGWMRRYRRRFSRLLPMVYGLTVIVVILGGALYPPRNYDALTYRIPRVLHWWRLQPGIGFRRPMTG